MIKNEYNGLLAKKYDVQDLTDKIAFTLSERGLRSNLGENGFQYVRKNHDFDTQAEKRALVQENPMKLLIVSFYFPPCTDGAATLMHNLCKYMPREYFNVITAAEDLGKHSWNDAGYYDQNYVLDCNMIRAPVKTNRLKDRIKFLLFTVLEGLFLTVKGEANVLLAVYPDEFDMFAAYFLRQLTRKPLIVYMHDLYLEVRKEAHLYPFWRSIEQRIFSSASVILVTNEKFKDYYSSRGMKNVIVLHSCVDLNSSKPQGSPEGQEVAKRKIKIVYTGSVYGANEDAIMTFLNAVHKMDDVEVVFSTPSKADYLKGVSVGFLPKKKCLELQRSADVLFLPLSFNRPIREEIECAFPVKVLEYVDAGKPILAVAPKGSFVEELIRKYDLGLVVTDLSERKIAEAIDELKDHERRAYFSCNASNTASLFDARTQSKKLFTIVNNVAARRL